jgi:hypothetical protein
MNNTGISKIRRNVIIILLVLGILLIVLSLAADTMRLDPTPGFGMIQMGAFLTGLTCLTLAPFLYLHSLRPKRSPRSLQADIGTRLGATGLVFIYVVGMSDLIGIGTHVNPSFERPFVGPLQLGGMALGLLMIIAGLILYYTSRGPRESSSLEFLINGRKNETSENPES